MDFQFYFQLFLRRLPLMLMFCLAGGIAAIFYAMRLPNVYQSEALVIIEANQEESPFSPAMEEANTAQALDVIQQRIFARGVLVDLAERLDLYGTASDPEAEMPPTDAIVADLRSRVTFGIARTGRPGVSLRALRSNRDEATVLRVGFRAGTPALAAAGANEIVRLIAQESSQVRTEVATQSLAFFNQEVERLGGDLAELQAEIRAFQEANIDSLPDSLDFRREQMSTLQDQLSELEAQESELRDRRQRQITLFETTGQTQLLDDTPGASQRNSQSPEEQELAELRSEYASLSAVLAPTNPRMTVLQARIDALERSLAQQAVGLAGDEASESTGSAQLDRELADIDIRLRYLGLQRETLEERIAGIQRTIDATPGNAITLGALERDYINLQEQYNRAVAGRARAETGTAFETAAQDERVTVLEEALPPGKPADPDRTLLAAAGFVGGGMMGFGLVVLLELINTKIRRPQDIEKALGIDVFGTIPYIRTSDQMRRRRTAALVTVAAVLLAVPISLWIVSRDTTPLQPVIESLVSDVSSS